MCYNTRVTRKVGELEDYYGVERLLGEVIDEDVELTYNSANGFAHPNMWIIPQEKPKNIIPVKWGLIPHYKMGANAEEYYKETIRWGSGLNAKSEKLFDSNNYKSSALKRRCIIPVDGFFEPHRIEHVKKPYSIPFYFERKNSAPFNLAGIYAVTPDKMVTFSILTKEATPLFAKIHNKKNRRPVILQDDYIDVWLDSNLNEDDVIKVIEDDLSDNEINTYPISKDLYSRSINSDRPDIIEKVEYEDLLIEY
ncbi:SOS response-associated peptidase [Maribacter algicola]|uniref:Abasic site processing protein n=1 Tax=Maribacter algicola TaxID=2498892 RepID=A0A426RLK3_9FLAO|nr:SOS response-associated peptidase family protein [Maribacter algicola]RRQ49819.1 SOS response-associated peptidase [Maribacter algicola]